VQKNHIRVRLKVTLADKSMRPACVPRYRYQDLRRKIILDPSRRSLLPDRRGFLIGSL
jgi:hypothetical protein